MLGISSSAAEAINALTTAQQLPGDAGVRISFDPQRTGALRLDLVDTGAESDRVVEGQGAFVFIDADVAPLLDDKALDASREGRSFRFTVLEADDDP